LRAQFQNLGFFNSVILGAVFLLFCFSVYAIKKLQPFSPWASSLSLLADERTRGALGVLFALFLMLAVSYVAGFLDSVVAINRNILDEPSVTIYLLLTPASWFGLALIYMLLLVNEPEPTVPADSPGHFLLTWLGLSGVNLMAVALTAVWQAIWARFALPASFPLTVAFIFLLYLLLFGPPRLLYLKKYPSFLAVISFIPYLAYLALLSAR
jgi:hypothetical protein